MNWYPRDASWHNRPDTTSGKKLHLPGRKRREGVEPLCGRNAVICDDILWDNPPKNLRCKNCIKVSQKDL